MSEAKQMDDAAKIKAADDMMAFMSDFARLLDQQVATVRKILTSTVDQAMSSVMAINAAADFKLKKADEVLVQDQSSTFISKSAKDIDPGFQDPAAKVRHINESLSNHMAGLSSLDENVRGFLFAIMGGLSVDDVVRQRLEHVSAAMVAMTEGVQAILTKHKSGANVTDAFVESVQQEMLKKMFKVYTMEEEKKVFAKVFGTVKGINQKP